MNDSEMTITLLTGEPEFRVLRRGDRCGLVRGDEALVTSVRQFIDTGRAEFDDSVVAVPGNTFCVVERDLLKTEAHEIANVNVDMTVYDGSIVYNR